MGSAHAPAPVDVRVERCMKVFEMPKEKIEQLWHQFTKYDREGTGHMPVDDFFERVIVFPRSALTDSLLALLDTKNDTAINFGEFTELVCTVCFFEKHDLMKYFFFILDPTRLGLVEKNELRHFILTLWKHQSNTSITEAFGYLEEMDDGDGKYNFRQVCAVADKYPIVFFPLFELQVQTVKNTLGEYWWESHKAYVRDLRDEQRQKEHDRLAKERKDAEKALETANDEIVRKRMGYVKFYLMPWLRAGERRKIAKIAAIESELEDKFRK